MTVIRVNPELNLWHPLNTICREDSVQHQIDSIFAPQHNAMLERDSKSETILPSADIIENDEAFVVSLDLPGISKDDVKISVEKNTLTVEAARKQDVSNVPNGYSHRERPAGSFKRSFRLSPTLKLDAIDAQLELGILTLTIPKTEEAKPRNLQIKVR